MSVSIPSNVSPPIKSIEKNSFANRYFRFVTFQIEIQTVKMLQEILDV